MRVAMKDSEPGEPLVSREVTSVNSRLQAPIYLLNANLFILFGLLIPIGLTLNEYFTIKTNFRGEPFKSGHGFLPSTVSFVVYDWNTAQGRIWFAAGLVGCLFLIMSNYAFELRNVYSGEEAITICGKHIMYWTTFRQILPVVGGLILIVPLGIPQQFSGPNELLMMGIHMVGGGMLFGGYIIAEMRLLGVCFPGSEVLKQANLSEEELRVRSRIIKVALVFLLIFMACGFGTATLYNRFCCNDTFVVTSLVASVNGSVVTVPTSILKGSALVEQTASGIPFYLNASVFISETIAALSLLVSQFAIWYYCEERQATYSQIRLAPLKDIEGGAKPLE